jgi:transcriptional regulator with XRE-family HTH domain
MSIEICADVFALNYAGSHKLGMEHDIPELLKKMMEALGGGQVDLAKRLGIENGQSYVSRWMGGAEPKGKNYQRIIALAHELGVIGDMRSEDVAAGLDKPQKKGVRIVGYVGAGAKGHFYAVAHDDYTVVSPPPGVTDQTVAVEIKGKSFGPLLDTWLVYYGQVCVIGLSDDRVVIKKIVSNGRGGFTLESNSGEEPIEDAEIEWAAKVIDMRPR